MERRRKPVMYADLVQSQTQKVIVCALGLGRRQPVLPDRSAQPISQFVAQDGGYRYSDFTISVALEHDPC